MYGLGSQRRGKDGGNKEKKNYVQSHCHSKSLSALMPLGSILVIGSHCSLDISIIENGKTHNGTNHH